MSTYNGHVVDLFITIYLILSGRKIKPIIYMYLFVVNSEIVFIRKGEK